MKLNVMAFVMMIIAIAIGKLVGAFILDNIGGTFAGGLFGALIVGFVCYLVYAVATSTKIQLTTGLLFAILVYFADVVASYLADMFALGAGDLVYFVLTGGVMAVLWSYIGAKIVGSSAVVSVSGKRRRR